MIASRYSARQSSSVAGVTAGLAARASASPRTAQPAAISASTSGASRRSALGAIDEQRLGGAADAGAAHLGIDDDFQRLFEIGRLVDIDVHHALEMREHRHARLALHALDEALAAARHDHVERAAEPVEHFADRLARGERRARDRRLGQAGLHEAGDEAGVDRGGGMKAVRAAAQHHRVAALEAERAGVGGDVGPALDRSRRRRRAASRRARSGARSAARTSRESRPTGSGRAATSSTPRAIASMRLASSASRSRKAAVSPFARASARSRALAARISAARSRSLSAPASSARVFTSAGALATVRAAARASAPIARMAARTSGSAERRVAREVMRVRRKREDEAPFA